MRQWLPRAGMLCWLTAVWILLWGNIPVANILGGLAVGLLITLMLPLPQVLVAGRLHPLVRPRDPQQTPATAR